MKKYTPIWKRTGLSITEIVMKDGKVYRNIPLRGENLADKESIKQHLEQHGIYYLTLGNHKKVWIELNNVQCIQ
jgi:hypothetical protein